MPLASTKQQRILYSDQHHCLSVCGNAVLSFSLAPPHPQFLRAWTDAVDRLAKQFEGRISVMTIVDGRCKPPDETSKRAIRETVLRHSTEIGAYAYVIEGDGFGPAALRSAVTMIGLVARYPFPQKVFKDANTACTWMLPHLPDASDQDTSASSMMSAVRTMRSAVRKLAATA